MVRPASMQALGAQAPGSLCPTSMWGGWGSRDLAVGMVGALAGIVGIQSEKEAMQHLNERLALPGEGEKPGR